LKDNKDKIERGEVSRRDFLVGAGAVVVGGAIGAGITYPLVAGKGGEVVTTTKTVSVPTTVTSTVGGGATVTDTKTVTSTVGGGATVTTTLPGSTKTVTTTVGEGVVEPAFEPEESLIKGLSFAGSGGGTPAVRCDVKNGKIVRVRPLHYDEEYKPEEYNPGEVWNITARGKTFKSLNKTLPSYLQLSYKKAAYSPNRILYPLKRVDWEPGGDPAKMNTQNRGKSKFKRISWDEATDTIASELKRVREKYGPYGVLAVGGGHAQSKTIHYAHGNHQMLLNFVGGYTLQTRNPDSWEGYYWGSKHVWGMSPFRGVMRPQTNVVWDMSKNTDMIVWHGDLETTPQSFGGQMSSRQMYWYTELGIKNVFVTPELNYSAAVHADKWIPVLPNTDAAWELAVIYTWIKEDTYDKDYVATHSVGFDKVSDYVLGKEDGVPKTPEWASPRCGVPEWTIKALAREWAVKTTSIGFFMGGSFMRGPYGTEPARLENVLLALQGVGKPGVNQTAWASLGGALPPPIVTPSVAAAGRCMSLYKVMVPQLFSNMYFTKAILDPPVTMWGSGDSAMPVVDQFKKYTYPIPKEEGGTEVHMVWQTNPCFTVCWNEGNRWMEAYRSPKIECYIVEHMQLQNDCLFADIVLPITTKFEDEDIGAGGEDFGILYHEGKAIEHIGESKSDYEAAGEVGKKLEKYGGVYAGLYEKYTGGKTVEEWVKVGYEKSGVADRISWEEFKEKGYYVVPVNPDWQKAPAGIEAFYKDPKSNPVDTPSGLLELYSERLAENFPDDRERPPSPQYVIGGPGWTHDESIEGERVKKYTMLLITNHPRWREHPMHDDIPWLREIPTCKVKGYDGYMYEPVWIHPTDAAKRGIESGDIVKVYNDRGIELGGAYVTERIMPGAAYMDHGARLDMIVCDPSIPRSQWVNRGGSCNPIAPNNPTSANAGGMATSGFLVEVEKLDPAEMEGWRKKYPEAFARDYDPAYGPLFKGWVEGGM
jgi:trimethylamine-N-oxide reductase (cytochrome c)